MNRLTLAGRMEQHNTLNPSTSMTTHAYTPHPHTEMQDIKTEQPNRSEPQNKHENTPKHKVPKPSGVAVTQPHQVCKSISVLVHIPHSSQWGHAREQQKKPLSNLHLCITAALSTQTLIARKHHTTDVIPSLLQA